MACTKITLSTIGGLGNNISGEITTNHNHLEKIDTAHETVSQYKAYDAVHLSENAVEQKPDKKHRSGANDSAYQYLSSTIQNTDHI